MPGDAEWFKYVISAFAALFSTLLGLVWRQVQAVKADVTRAQEKAEDDNKASRDRLWRAIEQQRQELAAMHTFLLQNYPTKDDLREMEGRLTSAIGEKR